MNNQQVCECIKKIDDSGIEYIADKCVKNGYGQSCGGYLSDNKNLDVESEIPSEKEHFKSYYEKLGSNKPTYNYLRCPQLLLYIAEVSGISSSYIEASYTILKEYEDSNSLRNSKKNGNYIWGKKILKDIKLELRISEVVKVINEASEWKGIIEKTKYL